MTNVFPTIEETQNGSELVTELNQWRTSILELHGATSRPSYAVAGTMWRDTTSATSQGIYVYDGSDDILIGTMDVDANKFYPGGASAAGALTNLGLTATAAELNLLDGALDHDTDAWEAGTATEAGVPSPADVKAAIDALAVTSLAAVDEDIIPDADSTRDIGSAANRWAEGWFDEVTTTDLSDGTVSVPTATVVNGSAKAWANLTGTGTIALNASLNVSSVTDAGTGVYDFAFTSAFSAVTEYTTLVTAANSTAFAGGNVQLSNKTASLNTVFSWVASISLADAAEVGIASHGDLA